MLQANCSGRSYPNAYSDTRLASLDPIQTSCLVLTKSTSWDIVSAIGSATAAGHKAEVLIGWNVSIFHVNFFREWMQTCDKSAVIGCDFALFSLWLMTMAMFALERNLTLIIFWFSWFEGLPMRNRLVKLKRKTASEKVVQDEGLCRWFATGACSKRYIGWVNNLRLPLVWLCDRLIYTAIKLQFIHRSSS